LLLNRVLYDQPFVDTFIHPLANGGRIIAGQFDDPYQLDEKGIFDLVNLNRDDLGISLSELKSWRIALVFAFGLLHGMGFAGALKER
jgi:hypothetical protein